MPDEQNNEKLFVDEDWKSRVEAEKEAARKAQELPPCKEADRAESLPKPTLTFLTSSLYLQGMVALGLLPSPGGTQTKVELPLAQHAIDLLDMLYEKTQGNRTDEETQEIDTALHELRLAYIAVREQSPKAG